MWLMPSYGRPDALRELLQAPGGWPACVFVLVNEDDPARCAYERTIERLDRDPWRLMVVPAGSRFAEAVRFAFDKMCPNEPFYGIIDDDYWPVTPGWHEQLVAAAGPNAIAIANNLQNFPKLYCCRVMGGELARAIGTIAPGTMRHNFTDDAWGRFAEDFGLLRPLEDVIVEHRHHLFTPEVKVDATYERGSSDFDEDRRRYAEWLGSDERRQQCERVAALLGGSFSAIDPKKIVLAICCPMQDMAPDWAYHRSLVASLAELNARGIRTLVYETAGGSHIGKARERVLWNAMANPEVTHLLFIDDDMGWDPHLPVRLLATGHEFAAAAGVRKVDALSLCFNPLPGNAVFHPKTRFLGVRDVGFAFVMLKRGAIERMCEHYPELRYNTGEAPPQWALFLDMIDKDDGPHGERLSEDFSFCRRWRAMGGEIWVDPEAALIHAGRKEYTGKPSDTFVRTEVAA